MDFSGEYYNTTLRRRAAAVVRGCRGNYIGRDATGCPRANDSNHGAQGIMSLF